MSKNIFVNGTFDLLHPGHIKLLRTAKALGSFLLVAIDSDNRVKQLKGKLPLFNQYERRCIIENICGVDQVHIFNSDTHLAKIIKTNKINIMVKGSDYIGKEIIGSSYCDAVVFIERDNLWSSSSLKDRM